MSCPFLNHNGINYGSLEPPMPEAPCYGCKRGLRRGTVYEPDGVTFGHVHEVRPGVTMDCVGLDYRLRLIFDDDDLLFGR